MPSAPRSLPNPSRARPTPRRSSGYSRAMSGTDDLFPDATPLPGAAVPPPPPVTGDSGVAPAGGAPAAAPRRRGVGAAAFVLGLLAILGDLIGIVVALFTLLGAVTN